MNTTYSKHLSEPTLEGARRDLKDVLTDFRVNETEDLARTRRDAGKWSGQEILGHLIDSALNNHQRFVRAQIDGHLQTLPDGSRALVLDGYDQNAWVQVNQYASRPWSDLVQLWAAINRQILHVMISIQASSLQTPCVIGGSDPVTLEALMIDYVGHVKHHLEQILE
jgi:hypothetical protein